MAIKIGLAFAVPYIIDQGYWKVLILLNGIVSFIGVVFILVKIKDTTYLTDRFKKEQVFDSRRPMGTIIGSNSSKAKITDDQLPSSIKSGQTKSDGTSNANSSNQGSIAPSRTNSNPFPVADENLMLSGSDENEQTRANAAEAGNSDGAYIQIIEVQQVTGVLNTSEKPGDSKITV